MVVVVVVTTVVWVAGAKENCPSVLSSPNSAMLESGWFLLRLLCSISGGGTLEGKRGSITSFGVIWCDDEAVFHEVL